MGFHAQMAVAKLNRLCLSGRVFSMLLILSLTCTTARAASFVDTTQADFDAGTLSSVDTTTSPGDVTLSKSVTLDQQNTAGTTTGTGFGAVAWTGQTFIPAVTGSLKQVDIQLFASGAGANPPNLTLSVRATSGGLPTGTDLASVTVAGSTFGDGAVHSVSSTFAAPATLTAGTQYALILRPVSAPAGSGYFWIRSSPSTYASGSRVLSADSGSTWSADTTRDYNFKTYIDPGFPASGSLTSSEKDSNPGAAVTNWNTLSWTATTPASTGLSFQVAASNTAGGPYNFVGPDGTAATFFTTSGAALNQFNGFRYLKYCAYLSSSNATTTPTLSDVTVDYAVVQTSNLSIMKTDGVVTATPGGSVTYTITASNAGPSDAIGATVADTFPATLTAVTWTAVGAGGGTATASGSGNINDTVNLPAGGSVTYTVTATISAAATGTLSNTATIAAPAGVTDPDPASNSATDTDILTPQADLGVTKTDGVATATPGGAVTYTITVANAGPSDVTGATVADTFPASLTANWTGVGAGGGTGTASGSGNINDIVNLPAGGSFTYTATCIIAPSATGALSNTATIAEPAGVTDSDPSNNSATDTDTLGAIADLSIAKTDGVTTAVHGGSVTYTVTVSNAGPSNVTGATVVDTLPAVITSATWTGVGAGGGSGPASGLGNINTSAVNLPAGGSFTFTVTASISATATGALSNIAIVAAPAGVADPNPGNNSATDSDTLVNAAPVFASAPTATPNPAAINQSVQFMASATDADGDSISYLWNFGDGSSSTSNPATHAYTTAGVFTVTVSATDTIGAATTSSAVFVTVSGPMTPLTGDLNKDGLTTPMDTDSDGDGFPDNIEVAFGSDANSSSSTPGGTTAGPFQRFRMTNTKLILLSGNPDRITFRGVLHIDANVSIAGQKVAIDAGGNTRFFQLDTRGNGEATGARLALHNHTISPRAREVGFSLVIDGELLKALIQNSPIDGQGRPTMLSVNICFNGNLLNAVRVLKYRK